jgi:hypothetical protein
MHVSPLSVMAEVAIPDARHCFRLAAPFIAVAAFLFVWNRMDTIINHLFPSWAWQKKLGWMNFTALRRADAFMRWLGYFVYAILAVALVGILWAAQGFPNLDNWNDPPVLEDLLVRVPILVICLAFWIFYLLAELFPRMSSQYEEEELQKFRAEQKELEHEEKMNPQSRVRKDLRAPFKISIVSSRPKLKR